MKEYSVDDKFDFGKHEGKRVGFVINLDIDYIKWCYDNVSGFCIKEWRENAEKEEARELKSKINRDYMIDNPWIE